MGHVFRCSPYAGTSKEHATLLAIADTVSDVNGNRFWMGQSQLAAKARVSPKRVADALKQLVVDGWLQKVQEASPTSPAVYELLIVERETEWDPKAHRTRNRGDAAGGPPAEGGGDTAGGPDAEGAGEGTHEGEGPPAAGAEPKRTQGEPNEGSTSSRHVAASCDQQDHLLHLEDAKGALVEDVRLCDDQASFEALWLRYPRHPSTGRQGGGTRMPKRSPKGADLLGRWSKIPIVQRRLALERLPWYIADLVSSATPPLHLERYLSRQVWLSLDGMPAEGADGLDDLELVIADVSGIAVDSLTGPARGDLVTAASALRASGADDGTVREMARRWRRQHPEIPVSPRVLVRHWARFAPQVTTGGRSSGPVCPKCKQVKDSDQHTDQRCDLLARFVDGEAV